MKYRIEITELKNGRKRYTPQVEITETQGGIFTKRNETVWVNILRGYPSMPTYDITRTGGESWGTEEEALEVSRVTKKELGLKMAYNQVT